MSVLVADGEGPVFNLGAAKADSQKAPILVTGSQLRICL